MRFRSQYIICTLKVRLIGIEKGLQSPPIERLLQIGIVEENSEMLLLVFMALDDFAIRE